MKQTVTEYMFRESFRAYGRQDNFSYDGLGALYEHLCDLEEDIGEELELDVISLCCDYSVIFAPDPDLDDEDNAEAFIELLRDHTSVIRVDDDRIIIQCF